MHAVYPPHDRQGPRLPSPAVFLHTPAFHHACRGIFLSHVLDQLCSARAVAASLIMMMSAPGGDGLIFGDCGDVPGPEDLRALDHMPLPFELLRPAKVADFTATQTQVGRIGTQRPGMSNNEPRPACMLQVELQYPALPMNRAVKALWRSAQPQAEASRSHTLCGLCRWFGHRRKAESRGHSVAVFSPGYAAVRNVHLQALTSLHAASEPPAPCPPKEGATYFLSIWRGLKLGHPEFNALRVLCRHGCCKRQHGRGGPHQCAPCRRGQGAVYFSVCLAQPHAEANQNLMRSVCCAGGVASLAKRAAEGTLSQFLREGMQRPEMSAHEPLLACMLQVNLQHPALYRKRGW